MVLNFSNRYQKVMPQVMDVPGFEGIRIHPGKRGEGDSKGCILFRLDPLNRFCRQFRGHVR